MLKRAARVDRHRRKYQQHEEMRVQQHILHGVRNPYLQLGLDAQDVRSDCER